MTGSASEIGTLLQELDGTETLLRATKSSVDAFTSNNPQAFIPVKLESLTGGRPMRSIDAIFPALLGLVSMLSCLLLPTIMAVKQKNQGLRARMRLTYAHSASLVFGRFLGDYAIGLLQVLVVLTLGVLVFGIQLNANYGAIAAAVLLAPAVFTAMGTLLAAWVSNESSAVLSSLLVSMPMLFLSGTLLPLEQIHGAFKLWAAYLPLYNVIELLSKVILRDAAAYAGPNFAILAAYFLGFLVLAYLFWRNRE
jgi:ABC-2 type transport system permease protein